MHFPARLGTLGAPICHSHTTTETPHAHPKWGVHGNMVGVNVLLPNRRRSAPTEGSRPLFLRCESLKKPDGRTSRSFGRTVAPLTKWQRGSFTEVHNLINCISIRNGERRKPPDAHVGTRPTPTVASSTSACFIHSFCTYCFRSNA